jgi:hypothetical protein
MGVPRAPIHHKSKSWSGGDGAAAARSADFRRAPVRVRRQTSPETSAFFNLPAALQNKRAATPLLIDPAAPMSDEPTIWNDDPSLVRAQAMREFVYPGLNSSSRQC